MTNEQTEKQSPISHFGDKLKQWQPGESGNPGGRPAGKSITAELRKLLDSGTIAEEIAKILIEVAKSKNDRSQIAALKELLDRTDGKVPDTHKIESDVPIGIVFKEVSKDTSESGQGSNKE